MLGSWLQICSSTQIWASEFVVSSKSRLVPVGQSGLEAINNLVGAKYAFGSLLVGGGGAIVEDYNRCSARDLY